MDDLRDPAALKAFVEAAKEGDRAGAAARLRELYERDPRRDLYQALRELLTYPEFAAIPPPPAEPDPHRVAPGPYRGMLGGTFAFPFSSGVSLVVIAVGGLLFAGGMRLIGVVGCLAVPIIAAMCGYLVAYWFDVVLEGAGGRKRPPGWPSGDDWLDYVGHFFRWWLATFAASLPAAVLFGVWLGIAERSESASVLLHPALIGTFVAGAAGVVYYPMSLLLAAFGGAWWAPLNLPLALSGIRKLGPDYFLCVGFFVATFVVATAAELWLQRTFTGWGAIAARAVSAWITFAMTVIQMRALGLLYYARSADLGWFR